MIVRDRDNSLQHIATDAHFEELRYGVILTVIDDNSIRTEIQWSRGNKEVDRIEL